MSQYTSLMYSFSYLEPVCCSMSSSNCCFLTCIQVSQEAGQVVWYSHLFQNFPQFIVIHTVKGFGIVSKAPDGAEAQPRGATPCPRSGAMAERSYPTPKVRGRGREELPHVQGKEQQMHFAGGFMKSYPTSKVRESPVRQ